MSVCIALTDAASLTGNVQAISAVGSTLLFGSASGLYHVSCRPNGRPATTDCLPEYRCQVLRIRRRGVMG